MSRLLFLSDDPNTSCAFLCKGQRRGFVLEARRVGVQRPTACGSFWDRVAI